MSEPFVAEIRIFAGNFAPRSWAFCNGQLLPISQNTALFSLIGTTYGGDGRTTTGLPNLQGRAPMHPGTAARASPPGRSASPAARRPSRSPRPQMPPTPTATAVTATRPRRQRRRSGADGDPRHARSAATVYGAATNLDGHGRRRGGGPTGGGQPHNNLQPFLGLNFIIALAGVYPVAELTRADACPRRSACGPSRTRTCPSSAGLREHARGGAPATRAGPTSRRTRSCACSSRPSTATTRSTTPTRAST